MKINFWGNTANNSYNLCKWMRKKGIDAHLFLNGEEDYFSLPEWEDEELKHGYPDFIYKEKIGLLIHPFNLLKATPFLKKISKCDLIYTFGWGPALFNFYKTPLIFHSFGGDLSLFPFLKPSLELKSIYFSFLAFLQRCGLRKSKKIIFPPFQYKYIKKLKLESKSLYLPWVVDVFKFKDRNFPKETAILKEKYKKYNIIFFHPARHFYNKKEPGYKGNDKAIKSFSKFNKEIDENSLLILINKGEDLVKSNDLIKELDIEEKVQWLEPLNQKELFLIYQLNNLIAVDQFNETVGIFGGVSREALMYGGLLITYFNSQYISESYGDDPPPIFNALTEDEIYSQMVKIYQMPDSKKTKLKNRAKEWIFRNHHWENHIDKYINLCREAIKK